jgi:chromosome segregation ATPase
MTRRKIFDLRSQVNDNMQPTQEEMLQFLESIKEEHTGRKHRDDFTYYLRDLKSVEDFESPVQHVIGRYSIDEQKLLGVLSHSRFFNHSLKHTIEQYKYHINRLRMLDFKKPQAFIRAVQEEINSLNAKKRSHRTKIASLQARIDKRREDIEALEKNRHDLTIELKNIALYVRDNLVSIQKLCESSIAVLFNTQLAQKMVHELTEDVKKEFKDELREQILLGPVSVQEAEKKKEDFLRHSKELSQLVLQERHSLRNLYEQVRDHVKKYAIKFDAPVRKIEGKNREFFEREREILRTIEEDLISLISDYRFEVKKSGKIARKDEHTGLIIDKQKEMMRRLLDFLQGKLDEKDTSVQPG